MSDPKLNKSQGRNHSDETRAKMSAAKQGRNHFFWGKKHSAETREKMRESALRRWKNYRDNNRSSR